MIRVRRYRTTDFENCLAVFDGNAPRHFGLNERSNFERFLRGRTEFFLIAEREDQLLACGGIQKHADHGLAEFRWVMVMPGTQGSGLGKLLLLLSAAWYFRHFDVRAVLAHTTPESAGFFRRLGFSDTTVLMQRNYWAPGLDLQLLRLDITDDCARLTENAIRRFPPDDLELEPGIRVS